MSTETAIIVAGVVVMFVIFIAALGWATIHTRGVRTPGATYFDK